MKHKNPLLRRADGEGVAIHYEKGEFSGADLVHVKMDNGDIKVCFESELETLS